MMRDNIINQFNEEFPQFEITYKVANYGGQIHVFFIETLDQELLGQRWNNLSSWIAGNFQTKLNTEFEIWNLYIFFIIPSNMNVRLKYRIENDTFSSRKIVIEGRKDFDEIINEHIIGTDIEVDTKKVSSDKIFKLEKDQDLQNTLEGMTLRDKRRTKNVSVVFNKLYNLLKSREDEV